MSNPALLITYFCIDQALAERLTESLIKPETGLALESTTDGEWRNIQKKTRLWCGRLTGMAEGMVVQLVLNSSVPIPQGWQILWEEFQRAQNTIKETMKEGLWGYTLVYQAAVVPEDTESAMAQVKAIPPGPWDGTLRDDTHYGQLYLLATPRGTGADAHTIYAVFCPPEGERALARDWTWAPNGRLLTLELALHRAQSQRRQYRAVASMVETAIEELWNATHQLLPLHPQRRRAASNRVELQALAEQYGRFSIAASDLAMLHRTLSNQTTNARQAAIDLSLADTLPVRHQLDLLRETEAQVDDHIGYAREALEAADSALGLLRTHFAEREACAQERRNTILTFLGLILGAGELITDEVARSSLEWMAVLLRWGPGLYTTAQVFVTRCTLAVLVGLVGMGIVWGIGKTRQA